MSNLRPRLLAALAGLLLLLPAVPALANYSYFPPTPQSVTVQVATPVFSQQIAPGAGTNISCSLTFQGKTVTMSYVSWQSACIYPWPDPLPAGTYQATITVSATDGTPPLAEPLTFQVAKGAISVLPQESLSSIETLRVVNFARNEVGLPSIGFDAALQAASQAHSSYFVGNPSLYTGGTSMHDEPNPQVARYTGSTPTARDNAFTAIGGGTEEMVAGVPSAPWSLAGLFDTTFHRFGLLDPTVTAMGSGFTTTPLAATSQGAAYVADMDSAFGGPGPLSIKFPWNGQTGVQTAFYGEDPDPLQGIAPQSVIGSEPESGYPVSLTFDKSRVQSVSLNSASLYSGGQPIPSYLVDSQNYQDQSQVYTGESMGTSAALFPKLPLQYGTTYTADFQGTVTLKSGTSQPFDSSWSFTTMAKPVVTSVYEDGSYLFVVGRNLENSYVSTYWWQSGHPKLGDNFYAGSHYLAYQLTGSLQKLEVTDGASGMALGDYPVQKAPLSDTGVSGSSQYYVDGSQAAGLVEGFLDHTYRPDASVTAAQAITMLWRAEGSPAPAGAAPTGVPLFARRAVAWAVAAQVVQPADLFLAGAPASRAQLATWLMRAYQVSPAVEPPQFHDAAKIPSAFAGYVAAAAEDGIVEGYPDGTFRPDQPVSRGAFAVWILRLDQALLSPASLF